MKNIQQLIIALSILGFLSACSSTHNLQVESQFPVPLVKKIEINMGLLLDEELRAYVYHETIERLGEWNVAVGTAQELLFTRLANGMFTGHTIVASPTEQPVDATLKPKILKLQFSLPEQTRSNFYEVWINYEFQLLDTDGQILAQWQLPAYGKANQKDYGNSQRGVESAAIAACRDAMAFFALNFEKEPAIKTWLDEHLARSNEIQSEPTS